MQLLRITLLIFHNHKSAKIKTCFRHYPSPGEQMGRIYLIHPHQPLLTFSLSRTSSTAKELIFILLESTKYRRRQRILNARFVLQCRMSLWQPPNVVAQQLEILLREWLVYCLKTGIDQHISTSYS